MGDPFPLNESSVESDLKKKNTKKNMGKRGFCFLELEKILQIFGL